jgi:hypothetical protein
MIAALFAQELVQDSAGNIVLAREVKVGGPNPPFLSKVVERGAISVER